MRFNEYSREASLRRRREQRSSARRRRTAGLLALALVGALAVGGTFAWLTSTSETVINTFTSAKVTTDIDEIFDGEAKENVKVTNPKNDKAVDVYIRAKMVVNWVELNGDGTVKSVSATAPVEGKDYTLQSEWGTDSGWIQGADGFWYWKNRVAPGGSTGVLIKSLSQLQSASVPENCVLSVEILSEAIQADGKTSDGNPAVMDAWGVTGGSSVQGVNSDGSLSIKTTA